MRVIVKRMMIIIKVPRKKISRHPTTHFRDPDRGVLDRRYVLDLMHVRRRRTIGGSILNSSKNTTVTIFIFYFFALPSRTTSAMVRFSF